MITLKSSLLKDTVKVIYILNIQKKFFLRVCLNSVYRINCSVFSSWKPYHMNNFFTFGLFLR